MAKRDLSAQKCSIDKCELVDFLGEYNFPSGLGYVLPRPTDTIRDAPEGKVGLYMATFETANVRLPFTDFFLEVLNYFKCHVSQLNPFGATKIGMFEAACCACDGKPTVTLFRRFFKLGWAGDWYTIEKRTEEGVGECMYNIPDAIRNWKGRFFYVDASVVRPNFPHAVIWRTRVRGSLADSFPAGGFDRDLMNALIDRPVHVRVLPEPVLYGIGISSTWLFHPARPKLFSDGEGMSFARFIHGGYTGATARPDRVLECELPKDVDFGEEVVTLKEKTNESRREAPVEGATGCAPVGKKRKEDVGTSKPMKSKKLKGGSGKSRVATEPTPEGTGIESLKPGKGKSMKFVQRATGIDPKVVKDAQAVYSLSSSEEALSVTGAYKQKDVSMNYTTGPLDSSEYPPLPDVEGLFVPGFSLVEHKSRLETEEEREDFISHAMVPWRKRQMEMMTNGAFQDYANETLIRALCVQAEHTKRFRLTDDDKHRLLKENNKLKKRIERLEHSEKKEAWEQDLDTLRGDLVFSERAKELMQSELNVVRKQLEEAREGMVKAEEKRKEAEDKAEAFALDLSESIEREKTLTQRNESLVLDNKKLNEEVEKVTLDRRQIVEGLPSVVRKLHKSYEYAKDMGGVQNLAVGFGGHLVLDKLHTVYPKLDVKKFKEYNPQAFDDLTAAGAQLEEKDFPYIMHLATSSELSAGEWLEIDPEPFPEDAP